MLLQSYKLANSGAKPISSDFQDFLYSSNKMVSRVALVALALPAVALAIFDPISIAIGGTTLALTGQQVAMTVGGLALLAIVKEKLILAELSRQYSHHDYHDDYDYHGDVSYGHPAPSYHGRHKRSAAVTTELNPLFAAIAATDVADCGKMLVCQVMARPQESLSEDERRVASLFEDDLDHIDATEHAHASYQLAALVGKLQRPELCSERYAKCPASYKDLQAILDVHGGQKPEVNF